MGDQGFGSTPNSYPDGSQRPVPSRDGFAEPSASYPQAGPPASHHPQAWQHLPAPVGQPLSPGSPRVDQPLPRVDQPLPPVGQPLPPVGQPLPPVGQPLPPVGQPLPTGPVGATTQRNWMGITSLVLGILGGGVLGAVLGGMGIAGARRGTATNRTIAVWGLVLNIAFPVLILGGILIAGLVDSVVSKDRVSYGELSVSECIKEPGGWSDEAGELTTDQVTKISCDETHWGQVYYRGRLPGNVYPGEAAIQVAAEDVCYSYAAAANLDVAYVDEAYVSTFLPTRASWGEADRTVVCFASNLSYDASESWVVDS